MAKPYMCRIEPDLRDSTFLPARNHHLSGYASISEAPRRDGVRLKREETR